ncbi:DNA-binding MarR family transcriptional regulator [Homoserinimonas aerilata]|uniref:DNA-binding MarR family transcriptional regulator n=2 Tax=Homoserinimonas aerilata TaxID=1162970 RepID=A0A542YJH4_9MICO|nr:DNA-binding MarR family transcriptional regulator [Homoserinimonas aerilata]
MPSAVDVLARLSFVTSARIEARASEAGLSVQQMRLLGILRDREPTINELTVHLGLDKSSVSGLVIRAERRGLVSRTQHEQDGRAVRVHLEVAGRALIDTANSQFENDVHRMFAALTETERSRWVALTTTLLVAEAEERGLSR